MSFNHDCDLTFLTALLPEKGEFLPDLAHSVLETKALLKDQGILAEWVLAVDGPGAISPVMADKLIRLPKHGGISATRNLGLQQARGEWLMPIDADDLLIAKGVVELVGLMDELEKEVPKPEELIWIVSDREYFDGQKSWFDKFHRKLWLPREWEEDWSFPVPFHPNNVLLKTEALLRAGGWPAVPVCEDMGVLLLMQKLGYGLSIPIPTVRYRLWPGQTVREDAYAVVKERWKSIDAIGELVNQERLGAGLTPVKVPRPKPGVYRDGAL